MIDAFKLAVLHMHGVLGLYLERGEAPKRVRCGT